MPNLISLLDVTRTDIDQIFSHSVRLKQRFEMGIREPILPGRVVGLLFEKPSLRTRVSFEAGITHLGGNCVYLGADVGWGKRESRADFGRVVGQYLDVLVCRARDHAVVEELAEHCGCPVINGLTDQFHPCQALADLFTLQELSQSGQSQKLAFVGDGNNVARSLAVACAHLDVPMAVASPPGYALDHSLVERINTCCPNADIQCLTDPREAVRDATVVYTDVWASMGQEKEQKKRKQDFANYQVNESLISHASKGACFMHCLPAHRGQEVTDGVIDGPQSVVVPQAANRMHVQKGILTWILEKRGN